MHGNGSNLTFPQSEDNLCYLLELYDLTRPLSDVSVTTLKTTIAVNSIMFPFVFLINLMVIWAILEDEDLRSVLHNQLIVLLALSDLLIGMISQPLTIAVLTFALLGNTVPCNLKMAYATIAKLLTAWSMVTLTALNIERYLAIQHPYFYIDPIKRRKIIVGGAALWLLIPALILSAHLAPPEKKISICRLIFFILASSSFIIVAFCTVKVQITAYRHRIALEKQTAAAANAQKEEYKKIQRKELRRCFTMLLSVVLYFALNAPRITVTMINSARNLTFARKTIISIPATISITILYIQALANPILFIICLSYVRKGVHKKMWNLIKFFRCKTNAQVHPTKDEN